MRFRNCQGEIVPRISFGGNSEHFLQIAVFMHRFPEKGWAIAITGRKSSNFSRIESTPIPMTIEMFIAFSIIYWCEKMRTFFEKW
jgi:hypothetical protein